MSKKVLLFILIALLLVYSLGSIVDTWVDWHLVIDNQQLEPIEALAALIASGAALVLLGVLLAVSLAGIMLFAGACILAALMVAGLSVAWPALILLLLVVWLVRDNKSSHQY